MNDKSILINNYHSIWIYDNIQKQKTFLIKINHQVNQVNQVNQSSEIKQ